MTEPRSLPAPGTLAVGLSFVGGFVDTFGFVALFGLFTAHVTGNFVLIGAEIVQPGPGVVAKLLALPVFMATVVIVCLIVRAREAAARSAVAMLLILQFILLAIFMASGLSLMPFVHADAWNAVVTGLIGVAAMAVQNAAARLVLPSMVPTTVMTGNVTQFVIDAVDVLRGSSPEARIAAIGRLKRFTPAMISFSVGAIAGAIAFAAVGFWALLFPLVTLATVILAERFWAQAQA
jgi:uncharacterized membrane protein YoaK (UPF0700 family)